MAITETPLNQRSKLSLLTRLWMTPAKRFQRIAWGSCGEASSEDLRYSLDNVSETRVARAVFGEMREIAFK